MGNMTKLLGHKLKVNKVRKGTGQVARMQGCMIERMSTSALTSEPCTSNLIPHSYI